MKSGSFYLELEELFILAHKHRLFPDGKKWADAIPNKAVETIKTHFEAWKQSLDKSLMDFINEHFTFPAPPTSTFVSDLSHDVDQHIRSLWPYLKRKATIHEDGSSLIGLKHDYFVPGGRFNEIYYWDSYFTMLGLVEHGLIDEVKDMINNFADFIDTYGFIPNGNRTYFLSRSQPPFFSLMVNLLANKMNDAQVLNRYLPQLIVEYNFWMSDSRVVQLTDGVLNRYWDSDASPRMEMYEDDDELGKKTRDPIVLFRHLRAACESGWDFSSRWFEKDDLQSIHTTNIIPVDLNCLLYFLEMTISKASIGDTSILYKAKAEARKMLIEKYLYDDQNGCYCDYNIIEVASTQKITAAMMFPLFFEIASESNAMATIAVLKKELVKEGGVVTTNIDSGQQWDAPNGWAPLQWISVMGLHNYNQIIDAVEIAHSWLKLNDTVFKSTGKMLEKYNVIDSSKMGGGGEYPVQDGFGWTNGVYVGLKKYLVQFED